MTDQSTNELVAAFQKGSRDAFSKLVTKYQNLVTSVAFSRTGDLQRSEDIAQQAFLVAWQKQDELENPEKFGAWLRGITSNLALNEVRLNANRQRSKTRHFENGSHPAIDLSVESETIRSEQNELLWSTLQSIPELYREPIILFYREGQSVSSVAQQLGLSNDAVKQRLSRGRAMMKKEIEELVEKMLFETRPQEAFCASVMSVLPAAMGSKIAVAAATKAGTVAGSKSIAAKISVGAATGAFAGVFGALIGLMGGITGAWLGLRQGIKHATSEDEKDLHRWTFVASVTLSLIYTGAMFGLVIIFRQSSWFSAGMIASNIVFVVALVGLIVVFTVRQSRLHKIYGKPKYQWHAKNVAAPTPMGLRLNSLGALFGIWAWLIILMAITGAWILLTASLAAFALTSCFAWITAPSKKNVLEQSRLAANLCLLSAWMEGAILTAGYVFDWFGRAKAYDNVPFWLLALGVVIFGSLLSVWIKFMGKKQHQAMVDSQKAKSKSK